jgi:hypothetical protein
VDERGIATHELSVPLGKLGLPAVAKLTRTALVRLGKAYVRKRDKATLIPIRWSDLESDAFPTFAGSLEVVPMASWLVRLAAIGEYEAPLGPIGVAFDATFGKNVADATAETLLQELRGVLETKPAAVAAT